MRLDWIADAAVVLLALAGMEIVAWWAHKHVMHGWGWGWHASHHAPHHTSPARRFERNDLYAIVFASIAIVLIALGGVPRRVGIGMTLYGLLYLLVHDGLVHQRLPGWRWQPRRGYLKRLVQAHRLHHAVRGREGCVSFGFLWAPSPARLRQALRERDGGVPSPRRPPPPQGR